MCKGSLGPSKGPFAGCLLLDMIVSEQSMSPEKLEKADNSKTQSKSYSRNRAWSQY